MERRKGWRGEKRNEDKLEGGKKKKVEKGKKK